MAFYLDVRTAWTAVQRGLVDTIRLGLGWREPEVADLPTLRATSVRSSPESALRYVQSEGVVYRWYNHSALAHNPPGAVQPAERAANGRWIRQRSEVTFGPNHFAPIHRKRTGYAKAVQLFQGQDDEEIERSFGRKPGLLVEFVGDSIASRGRNGEIYDVDYDFVVHCLSQNLRPGPAALEGSPVDVEANEDPGLNRIIGDVRYLLAGCRLDMAPAVMFVDIQGKAQIRTADLGERTFVGMVPLTVRASWNIPDEDLVRIEEIWIQGMDADTGDDNFFDVNNFVRSGYRVEWRPGLVGTPAPGQAIVDSQIVVTAPTPHLFTVDRDTYRDLRKTGELVYQEVAIDADPPPQERGTLRIGVTRTDSAGIVSDTLLCHFAIDSGAPFRAPRE